MGRTDHHSAIANDKVDSLYPSHLTAYPYAQAAENTAVVVQLKKRIIAVNRKISGDVGGQSFFRSPDIAGDFF